MLNNRIILLVGESHFLKSGPGREAHFLFGNTNDWIRDNFPDWNVLSVAHSDIRIEGRNVFITQTESRITKVERIIPLCSYRLSLHPRVTKVSLLLEKLGVPCFNSAIVSRITNNKIETHEVLTKANIPAPKTLAINLPLDREEISKRLSTFSAKYIVLKSNQGSSRHRVQIFPIERIDKMLAHAMKLLNRVKKTVLIQEKVKFNVSYKVYLCDCPGQGLVAFAGEARLLFQNKFINLYCGFDLMFKYLCTLAKIRKLNLTVYNNNNKLKEEVHGLAEKAGLAIARYSQGKYGRSPTILVPEIMFNLEALSSNCFQFKPVVIEVNSFPGSHELDKTAPNEIVKFRKAVANSIKSFCMNQIRCNGEI